MTNLQKTVWVSLMVASAAAGVWTAWVITREPGGEPALRRPYELPVTHYTRVLRYCDQGNAVYVGTTRTGTALTAMAVSPRDPICTHVGGEGR